MPPPPPPPLASTEIAQSASTTVDCGTDSMSLPKTLLSQEKIQPVCSEWDKEEKNAIQKLFVESTAAISELNAAADQEEEQHVHVSTPQLSTKNYIQQRQQPPRWAREFTTTRWTWEILVLWGLSRYVALRWKFIRFTKLWPGCWSIAREFIFLLPILWASWITKRLHCTGRSLVVNLWSTYSKKWQINYNNSRIRQLLSFSQIRITKESNKRMINIETEN